jgi:hypothetical protein
MTFYMANGRFKKTWEVPDISSRNIRPCHQLTHPCLKLQLPVRPPMFLSQIKLANREERRPELSVESRSM